MRTSALFDAKNFGFFENYGLSARTKGEGLSQCGHFAARGKGSIFFTILCGVLYERPLEENKNASTRTVSHNNDSTTQ